MTEQSVRMLQEAQNSAGLDRSRVTGMRTDYAIGCEGRFADGELCRASCPRVLAVEAIQMAESVGCRTDEEIAQWIVDGLREDAAARGWTYQGKDLCPACSGAQGSQRIQTKNISGESVRMLRRGR